MISKLQKPIDSGFNSKSNAHEITKDVDLNGKIAIVTGGYSGIGLETTRELVSSGAEVIIPAKRSDVAIKNLEGIVSKDNVIEMDLSDLNSVKNFTDGYKENFNRLDLLINNAGIMAVLKQELVITGKVKLRLIILVTSYLLKS